MTVSSRLKLTSAVAIVSILLLSIALIYEASIAPYFQAKEASELAELGKKLSDVIHLTQRERYPTVGYVGSGGQEFVDDLKKARAELDKAITKLPPEYREVFAQLPEVRRKVDNLEVHVDEAFAVYANIIKALLDKFNKAVEPIENKELFQHLKSLYFLSSAKEQAGFERSTLVKVFTKDILTKEDEITWRNSIKKFDTLINEFLVNAPEEISKLYKDTVKDDAVIAYRKLVEMKTEGYGANPESWAKASTVRINAIRKVEEALSEYLIRESEHFVKLAIFKGLFIGVVTLITFLIVFTSLVKTSRRITLSVEDVLNVISSTAETGKFGSRLKEEGNDEFARIAKSFNQLMNTMSQVVEEIKNVSKSASDGDFSKRIEANLRGDLQVIKESLNSLVSTLGSVVREVEEVMRSASQGDFSKGITIDMKGELAKVKENVNNTMSTLGLVVEDIKDIATCASQGDFSKNLSGGLKGDFLTIGESLNSLIYSMKSVIEEIKNVMASAAIGDFSKRITGDLKGELLVIKDKINAVMDVLEFLNNTLISVANAMTEITGAIELVEQGTNVQAESTSRIASSVEEISSAVESTSVSIDSTFKSIEDAYKKVEKATSTMEIFKSSMDKVKKDSERITEVVEAIQGIAEQVNLLALNAAIEAARAGEQGRGFAVVADEVRRLAEQVSKMAGSVSDIVRAVVSSVEEGVKDTELVYQSFGEIEQYTKEIRESTQRISTNMEEVYTGMREISAGVSRLKDVGNNNAAAVEEVTAKILELNRKVESSRKKLEGLKG